MPEDEHGVEFVETSTKLIAVIKDESHVISDGDVVIHDGSDEGELLFISANGVFPASYNDRGWVTFPEIDDIPEEVVAAARKDNAIGVAEADVSGYPVKFDVVYKADDPVYSQAWQTRMIRPSVAEGLKNEMSEIYLTVQVNEDGHVTITDLDFWPLSSSVTIDLE